MDTPCLLIRAISGSIAVENDSGLLLALAILNGSVPMAEKTKLDGTLIDLSCILTIENETEMELSKIYFDVSIQKTGLMFISIFFT